MAMIEVNYLINSLKCSDWRRQFTLYSFEWKLGWDWITYQSHYYQFPESIQHIWIIWDALQFSHGHIPVWRDSSGNNGVFSPFCLQTTSISFMDPSSFSLGIVEGNRWKRGALLPGVRPVELRFLSLPISIFLVFFRDPRGDKSLLTPLVRPTPLSRPDLASFLNCGRPCVMMEDLLGLRQNEFCKEPIGFVFVSKNSDA